MVLFNFFSVIAGAIAISALGVGISTAVRANTHSDLIGMLFQKVATSMNATMSQIDTGVGLSGGPITTAGTISLADTAVQAGSYVYASLTVDPQGRLTAVASGTDYGVDIAGLIMTVSHLNMTVSDFGGVNMSLSQVILDINMLMAKNATMRQINTGTGLTGGPITMSGTVSLANTAVVPDNYSLATIAVDSQGRITSASSNVRVSSVTAGTGLSGGTITTAGTIHLADTTVSAGTYGDENNVPQITVDAQGRLTSVVQIRPYQLGAALFLKSSASGNRGFITWDAHLADASSYDVTKQPLFSSMDAEQYTPAINGLFMVTVRMSFTADVDLEYRVIIYKNSAAEVSHQVWYDGNVRNGMATTVSQLIRLEERDLIGIGVEENPVGSARIEVLENTAWSIFYVSP